MKSSGTSLDTCLARIFWAAFEISASIPGPPIWPKNSTTVTSEPNRLQTEAYIISVGSTGEGSMSIHHFQANDTTTDNDHLLGNFLERP